jgi:hypothetical protein
MRPEKNTLPPKRGAYANWKMDFSAATARARHIREL